MNEQAGIQAGTGGFDITVKGSTDLTGAVIASAADASQNTLTTGTLSFSDIQNSSNYNASSGGFSAGASYGNGGNNYATHGNTSGQNTGGGAPMLSQSASGSDSATTKKQRQRCRHDQRHPTTPSQQDLASLNRDTTNTNGTVAQTPDVNNLLNQQADMMSAASAAGEAVSKRIGDFASSQGWAEGSLNRALMQAAGAALVAELGGGNALGAAAGAGVASIAAGNLNELSTAIAGSNPTGNADINQALGNIVANVIATGAGAAVGGNAGAVSGSNVDLYNRQLHPQEKTLAQQIAAQTGGQYSAQDVANQLAQMGFSQNGVTESGAAATVEGATPPNDGTTWAKAGVDQNTGQTIWTQTLGAPNLALQALILQNTNGADVPLLQQYSSSPSGAQSASGSQGVSMGSSAGSICPGGNCGIAYGPLTPTMPSPATITDLGSTGLGIAAIWLPPPFDLAAVTGSAVLKSLNYLYSPPSSSAAIYDAGNAGVGAVLPQGQVVQTLFSLGTTLAQPYVVPSK